MKIPSVALRIQGDAVEVLYKGMDKGAALAAAKSESTNPVDQVTEIRVVVAIGAGIAWRKRLVPTPSVVVTDADLAEPAEEETTDTDPADVAELRAALKAKGVKVPPRISADNLLALAVEHGVDA